MDSGSGDAAKKPLRVTLEPAPERRIRVITQTGEEEPEPEQTAEDRFLKIIKQIDFAESQTGSSKSPFTTPGGTTTAAKARTALAKPGATAAQTWDHFAQAIGQAMGELTSMIELINRIRDTKHIALEEFTRLRQPDKAIITDITVAASQKQAQLQRSAEVLEDAAIRLKKAQEDSDRYLNEVVALRQRWRITSRASNIGIYEPLFYVDLSYGEDGAPSRKPILIPLIKAKDGGHVSIEILASTETSYLHIVANLANRELAIGVTECHNYLLVLQQAVWNDLVFKQLKQDGIQNLTKLARGASNAPQITSAAAAGLEGLLSSPSAVFSTLPAEKASNLASPNFGEKEIQFETLLSGPRRQITLKLARRAEEKSVVVDDMQVEEDGEAMAVDGEAVTSRPLRLVERQANFGSESKPLTVKSILDSTLEIVIHSAIRGEHLKRLQVAHSLESRVSTAKWAEQFEKLREKQADQLPGDKPRALEGILWRTIVTASHLQLVSATMAMLRQMSYNLARALGPLGCHWIPTSTPGIASFDLSFAPALVIPVTIKKATIFLSASQAVFSPEQLGQFVLDKIISHVMGQIYHQAQALLPKDLDKISRQTSTLVLEFPPNKIEVHIYPTKSLGISVTVRESTLSKTDEAESRRGPARKLQWTNSNPVQAIVELIRKQIQS